jgi:nucleotide-binding universal stress UspA family protein
MKAIQRIVVATDFSPIADHALDRAVSLAAQLGASVTLVHAYELPMLSLPDGVVVATAEMMAKIVDAAQKHLTETTERLERRGVAIKSILRSGVPWEEINDVAAVENADLIVVGTHGRRGLSRALMGSVAERLIRTATLPVLVVPAEGSKNPA